MQPGWDTNGPSHRRGNHSSLLFSLPLSSSLSISFSLHSICLLAIHQNRERIDWYWSNQRGGSGMKPLHSGSLLLLLFLPGENLLISKTDVIKNKTSLAELNWLIMQRRCGSKAAMALLLEDSLMWEHVLHRAALRATEELPVAA